MSSTVIGQVVELWRYPVKSLQGERLDELACDDRGVVGDRRWAVQGADGKLGSGKTTRRFRRMPGLLSLSSCMNGDAVIVCFPDGTARRLDDPATAELIGQIVGEPVDLVEETRTSHLDAGALHLLTTSSLGLLAARHLADDLDSRRFRPNVVIETGPGNLEASWLGRHLLVGSTPLAVDKETKRCVMVTMAQNSLGLAPGILKDLERSSAGRLGVYGHALGAGVIRLGDDVLLSS